MASVLVDPRSEHERYLRDRVLPELHPTAAAGKDCDDRAMTTMPARPCVAPAGPLASGTGITGVAR
jgi:hypothetical protein